jgi:hypothetical protein
MPRYFFHVHDGVDRPDPVGTELPDIKAARSEAIRTAGELLRDLDGNLEPNTVWEMNVVDETGRRLLKYRFSATEDLS